MSIRFQFLIGRVKIDQQQDIISMRIVFQFLIGRVKIQSADISFLLRFLFQFLIGRVKIWLEKDASLGAVNVSIPYR